MAICRWNQLETFEMEQGILLDEPRGSRIDVAVVT